VPTANPYAAAPGAAQGPGFAQLAPGPFAVPTTTDLEFPEPRKKTPLIIGGIVLVLAAAAIAVVVTQSKAPPPPPVPTVAPTLPTSTPPNATPTNTPVPDVPTPSSAPQDDIAGRPAPAPAAGNDFSQMFAQGAEKAQKGSPSGAAKSFDAEEARAAVAGVLKAVAACKEAGGATGQSSAAVTFDASGQVSSVTVGAPFAGTSTGTCIITALKAAKVTPFSGLPGTVSQPVSLQ
jgi:predicted component of type VI protein secretion system